MLAINQVNWWSTVSGGFLDGFSGERASRDEQTFIRSTLHCTTEIANLAGCDRGLVALALKEDVEAQEAADSRYANAIDATVTIEPSFSSDCS